MNVRYTEKYDVADILVLPLYEGKVMTGIKAFDPDMASHIGEAILADFGGKSGQSLMLYGGEQYPRLLLAGLGKEREVTMRSWRKLVGSGVIAAQDKKATSLTLVLPSAITTIFGSRHLGQVTTVAADVAAYSYDDMKAKDARIKPLESFTMLGELPKGERAKFEMGVKDGRVISGGVNLTRHLGNTPPSIMTPTLLAKETERAFHGDTKVKVTVLSRPEMKRLGMGCLLGVSRGSSEEPKFVIVEYTGTAKEKKPTVLVGKGITFDSGGLSLKPSNFMSDMKFDMLGAATVVGTLKAAAELRLKKNIIGLIPTCENMPSGESYRPDDILVAMNGKSVEIQNTDAEGRLILADALSFAGKKYDPKEVIDFATLTGACVVAIGTERSGLFSDEEKIVQGLLKASESIGEQLWRLPLGEEYTEAMKSEVADLKNIGGVGGPSYGGASTAAAFLKEFTSYPWAHIDLSSSYKGNKGSAHIRAGANGFGVETMIEYLR